MKKLFGILITCLISLNTFSQATEQDINALSIFSEYVKAKNYDAAFESWMELRLRSPKFNSAIYVYGERILKHKIKNSYSYYVLNYTFYTYYIVFLVNKVAKRNKKRHHLRFLKHYPVLEHKVAPSFGQLASV